MFTGTALQFTSSGSQGSIWTTGKLESDFLGITNFGNGSPPNPIGAFLPSTDAVDPGATGYIVLTLDLGALTVPEQGGVGGTSPFDLNFGSNLPLGTWVLGDACTSGTFAAGTCTDVTTAQSAALFINTAAVPAPIVGAGLPGLVAACGLMFGLARRRRKQVAGLA